MTSGKDDMWPHKSQFATGHKMTGIIKMHFLRVKTRHAVQLQSI